VTFLSPLPFPTDHVTFSIDSGEIAAALEAAFRRLADTRFSQALRKRRLDVWPGDAATRQKIGNRLGWFDAIETMSPHVPRLRACAQSVRDEGLTTVVLLGMGGSSLAPEVMRNVVGVAPGWPAFRVLDSVDPDAVNDAMDRAATSLFVFASKSGTTIEPNVMAAEAGRRLRDAGVEDAGSRFIAITDADTALHKRAIAERFRDVFINPSDIGGRYSALSFFGLLPAALMGIDLDALLDAAREMSAACRLDDPRANPGLALGAAMAAAAVEGRDKLTLRLPGELGSFGLWVEQLVAESTGKQGKGVVPIAQEPDVPLGDDRIVVVVTVGGNRPAGDGGYSPGTPIVTLDLPDTLALGAAFFQWEVATAAAGLLLDINPFDEPNVQQAKDATRGLLDVYATQHRLPALEPHASVNGARFTLSNAAQQEVEDARAFLQLIRPRDYLGLLAYLPPDDETVQLVLQELRGAVGRGRRCATMLGYGPRYLHSTGQLHKGGPNSGVFVLLTADCTNDLAIPGEPYSFGVLETAQAVGDFQSLDRAGRRALYIHLPDRTPQRLRKVAEALLSSLER
jgi:glucose-6-phosphate isomerase/transaldolase/glucose-6-phosphate isomerase